MAGWIFGVWRFSRRKPRAIVLSALLGTILLSAFLLYELGPREEYPPLPYSPPIMAEDFLPYPLPMMAEEYLPVCSALIRGELVGKKDEIAQLLPPQKRLSEEFYRSTTKDCQAYKVTRGFVAAPLSAAERDFPIAYSMAIHGDVEMFERLLRAVYHPQNVYCVHLDRKSAEGFQEAVRAIVSCFPNVFVASKLERVSWGTWSLTQAHLNCMDDLLKSPVEWKYLLNTCGADLPIKTNAEMVRALKVLNGQNSLESMEVPDSKKVRWQYHHQVNNDNDYIDTFTRTGIRKTPPPIPMFSGSNYFVVTREFVKHVLESKEAQDFMEWSKDTECPEEHFWASLNRLSSVPGSEPAHSKYHRSDMTTIARLQHWAPHKGDVVVPAPYPPCTSTLRRAVCVYGSGDLRWLFRPLHQQLMANKFDRQVDDTAIRCVEAIIRFKALNAVVARP